MSGRSLAVSGSSGTVLLWNSSEVNKYDSQITYILVIQKSISLNIGGNERELVSSKHA